MYKLVVYDKLRDFLVVFHIGVAIDRCLRSQRAASSFEKTSPRQAALTLFPPRFGKGAEVP